MSTHNVKTLPPFSAEPPKSIDARRLEAAFDRALEFRRACPDQHGISNAVICALEETKAAILESLRLP